MEIKYILKYHPERPVEPERGGRAAHTYLPKQQRNQSILFGQNG